MVLALLKPSIAEQISIEVFKETLNLERIYTIDIAITHFKKTFFSHFQKKKTFKNKNIFLVNARQ